MMGFARSPPSRTAPFVFWHEDTILIPVRCGAERWTALLDTGAAATVIDAQAARAAGFSGDGVLTLHSANASTHAQALSGRTLEIGAATITAPRLVAQDLTSIAQSMGHAVELVLGEDLFRAFAVGFDFDSRRMSLASAGAAAAPGRLLPLGLGAQGRRLVAVEIEDHPPVDAVFDLGSSTPLMIDRRYANSIGLLDGRPTSTAALAQLTGVDVTTTTSVRRLAFAGQALQDVPAELLGGWQSAAAPVVLGLPALAQFRLTVDYAASAVWVGPDPAAHDRPILRDLSGLGLAVMADRLQVVHVAKNGPAEGAWSIGDEIVAINGEKINEAYGRGRLWRWRSGGLGAVVRLTLPDGDVRTLRLARHY